METGCLKRNSGINRTSKLSLFKRIKWFKIGSLINFEGAKSEKKNIIANAIICILHHTLTIPANIGSSDSLSLSSTQTYYPQ